MEPHIEWDPHKEQINFKKHGVQFTEAVTALEDELALTIEDDHPAEVRLITLGTADTGRLLVVVYTFRGENIRIISARKATAAERQTYERDNT